MVKVTALLRLRDLERIVDRLRLVGFADFVVTSTDSEYGSLRFEWWGADGDAEPLARAITQAVRDEPPGTVWFELSQVDHAVDLPATPSD